MQIWFKNGLFESEEDESDIYDTSGEDSVSDDIEDTTQLVTRKVDPEITIKRVNLSNRLYANIIEFIKYNVGEVDELKTIIENQERIHNLFDELAHEVSGEYNALKGKEKESVNIREDSTLRKINAMYRFFAYYIIKYDKLIVEWMENLIKVGLFNEKSNIKRLNNSYSNIDISLVKELQLYELTPESFYILDNDTFFNKTLGDFFKDSGDLIERLARGPGLFNNLSSMMVTFRTGLLVDYVEVDEDGNKSKNRSYIPIENTIEIKQVIEAMTAIEATINSIISVDKIREKYVNDYKNRLAKLNLNQEQISKQLKLLDDSIKGGKINTVEDFNKIQSEYKKLSSTSKEKEDLGNRLSRMADAYKFKIESIINNRRGL